MAEDNMRSVVSSGELIPVPHYSYELPSDEENRYEQLFRQLDANGDGRIDIRELSEALHKHGVPESLKETYAQVSSHLTFPDPLLLSGNLN